ncbi:hypothetical protein CRG98_021751 [Punica granatum]|uniref:Uncharacterized protein n=1 Tax=Punica granatum TaxID=22663 RepID=A0A2I0JNI8_PUNGR|nr:hypothetical protein CRG98_021751 [Punica granatum]
MTTDEGEAGVVPIYRKLALAMAMAGAVLACLTDTGPILTVGLGYIGCPPATVKSGQRVGRGAADVSRRRRLRGEGGREGGDRTRTR